MDTRRRIDLMMQGHDLASRKVDEYEGQELEAKVNRAMWFKVGMGLSFSIFFLILGNI